MVRSRRRQEPSRRARFIDPDYNIPVTPETEEFCALVEQKLKRNPRQWQKHAIQTLKAGRDVFVKAGTGSGKSLPYQAMTLLSPTAIVLVVCPTVALMHDQVLYLFIQSNAEQVDELTVLGISAIALDADTLDEEPALWRRVEAGEFRIVYATPESLFDARGHFQTNTIRHPRCAFMKNLVALAIDECHLIWDWQDFRVLYRHIGSLRLVLRRMPVICTSATVTPNVGAYVHEAARLEFPTARYNLTTRRNNINIIVAPIDSEGIEPLRKLIPRRVRTLTDIPKTLIFHDAIDPGIHIADELAALLPTTIEGIPRDQLVTAYYASIDKKQKKKMLSDFREGTTRIMICTDAFGLGVNIPDVERVIQWHVDEKFTLSSAHQRIGRAARDPSVQGVAVIYVKQSILDDVSAGDWEEAWDQPDPPPEDDEEDWDINTDGIRVIPVSKSRRLELFGLPIRLQTLHHVETHVRQLYQEVKSFHDAIRQAKAETRGTKKAPIPMAKKLDPAVVWLLATKGCRHRVFSVMFEDPDLFESHRYWCCDCCVVEKGENLGDKVVAGISPDISFSNPNPPEAVTAAPAAPKPTRLEPSGHEKTRILQERLRLAREYEWRQLKMPDTIPSMLLSDKILKKLCTQVKFIVDEDALRAILEDSGVHLKYSFLSDGAIKRMMFVIERVMTAPLNDPNSSSQPSTIPPLNRSDHSHFSRQGGRFSQQKISPTSTIPSEAPTNRSAATRR